MLNKIISHTQVLKHLIVFDSKVYHSSRVCWRYKDGWKISSKGVFSPLIKVDNCQLSSQNKSTKCITKMGHFVVLVLFISIYSRHVLQYGIWFWNICIKMLGFPKPVDNKKLLDNIWILNHMRNSCKNIPKIGFIYVIYIFTFLCSTFRTVKTKSDLCQVSICV